MKPTDHRQIWNSPNYRPNVNGKLQSYSVFFGRVW
jgi:hypothetical protein